jgi:hypothetical protein
LNLLYFQAELVQLEEDLRGEDSADQTSLDPKRRLYHRSWRKFSMHKCDPAFQDSNQDQWNTMMKIREVLKQYSKFCSAPMLWCSCWPDKAVISQSMIAKLTKPTKGDFKYVQEWAARPSMGNVDLVGSNQNVWSEVGMDGKEIARQKTKKRKTLKAKILRRQLGTTTNSYKDMIAYNARGFDESMSRIITEHVISWFHSTIGKYVRTVSGRLGLVSGLHLIQTRQKPAASDIMRGNTFHYSNKGVLRLVSIATMSLASLFPIVSIIVLSYVQNKVIQLSLIVVFTVTFSLCLGLYQIGRKPEIFSASAAFAAVQVVFVSGGNTTVGSGT